MEAERYPVETPCWRLLLKKGLYSFVFWIRYLNLVEDNGQLNRIVKDLTLNPSPEGEGL